VQQDMELDMSCDDFDYELVRQTLADQFNVDIALISFDNPCAASRRMLRQARALASLSFTITIASSATADDGSEVRAPAIDNLLAAVANITEDSLASSLGSALNTTITVTKADALKALVRRISSFVCPTGAWCTAGKVVPCPRGTYNNITGQTYSAACQPCPDFSTTANESSTSVDECRCREGFQESTLEAGSIACVCEPGFAFSNGGCSPCLPNTFKPTAGNGICTDCEVAGTMTVGSGATSQAACVCKPELYAKRNASTGAFTCEECLSTHEVASLKMTDCSAPGTTLEALPLQPGFWRQSNRSRLVRACEVEGVCIGGSDVRIQCNGSHTGPLCDLCKEGFYGGRGKPCEECEGDVAVTIALPVACIVVALLLIVLLLHRYERRVVDAALNIVDVAGSRVDADKGKIDVADALQGAALVSPPPSPPSASSDSKPKRMLAQIVRRISNLGVKLRILISLVQVITQLGVTFDVQYPPFFTDLLSYISLVNLSVGLLPFACVLEWVRMNNFYFELLTKTLMPLTFCLMLTGTAKVLRSCDGPRGKLSGWSDACDNLWFFTLFLMYPSICSTIFQFFVIDVFDGDGEERVELLRVDRSIDTTTDLYYAFFIYDIFMLCLFPIGVPLYYASIFFRNRHELRELGRIERTQETNYRRAMLLAAGETAIEERVSLEVKAA